MYAIIAYLDCNAEMKINNLRDGMKKAGIAVDAMRPHVTLATHADLQIESFKKDLEKYFQNTSAVPLFFPSLCMFLNSGTIYAAPTKDKVLDGFHQRYHEQFKEHLDPNSLYDPSQWVPHCTIAMHLTHQKLVQAFDYSARNLQPFHATLDSIALIKLQYEADVCTSAKDLMIIKLKKSIVDRYDDV